MAEMSPMLYGYDIVFVAADGSTLLDFELERHVATTGEYVAWVRIPTLDYNDDMDIYIYYGNSFGRHRSILNSYLEFELHSSLAYVRRPEW